MWQPGTFSFGRRGIIMRERRGQVAVGVGLGKQVFGLLLEDPDGVGAAAQRCGGSSWLAS
jgi:hypothetical protein